MNEMAVSQNVTFKQRQVESHVCLEININRNVCRLEFSALR